MGFEGVLEWCRHPSVGRTVYPKNLSDRRGLHLEASRHALGEHLHSLQYFL